MTASPIDTVRSFCAAWSRLDLDELLAYFTEDAVYHNMPGPPAIGLPAVRATIERFLGGWEATTWEILEIAAAGNVVFAERIDRTVTNGKRVDLPVVGVFEVVDGRIRAWRDYFDLGTYTRALA